MYCGSTDYGKGCRYGPHGVHLHADSPGKCVYCKSASFGKGCKLNPTSDLHIHGINYNSMFKEKFQSFLSNEILLQELKKDFTEFRCFTLGIIDAKGNKIKTPITEEEKASFSPLTKTLLRIKRYIGPKIELIDISNLTESRVNFKDDLKYYQKLLTYRDKIDESINNIYKVIDDAQADGIQLEDINALIQA